ncbi:MAG TPA: M20/M25/M40 family metallo-hydrolase [Acidimicrobiales bacterium]|nr:M20/M25/M40 family metallo-hydrolase [Acidimicrobiales bacterium]
MSTPTPSVTEAELERLIGELVRLDSVTPWLVEGGAGEAAVARYLAEWVSDLPVEVELDEIEPGRVNFVATLRGAGGGPSLCLNAHADTVGYALWPERALTPRREGDRLYGLGASDDKGCCAVALLVLRHFATRASRLRGDLTVACVADEEGVSIGTERLVATRSFDLAIVLEADALDRVVVEHQGFGWIDVVVNGRAAHGSAPEAGVDAIVGLAEVVTRLGAWGRAQRAVSPPPRNGATVFHTGTVRGGTDYATYPSRAEVGLEIGTQPGERLADRVAEIEAVIDEVATLMPGLTGEVRVRLEREPFRAAGHEGLLASLQAAARQRFGFELSEVGLNAWTDAALMQSAGIPTLLLGPLGGNLHSPEEWVSLPEAAAAVDLLVETIAGALG